MKINVTTNIRTNTRKYSSLDEVPPELRAMCEQAMTSAGSGEPLLSMTGPTVATRLVVNGHELDPTKEMSETEQKLYADVCQLLKGAGAATEGSARNAVPPAPTIPSPSAAVETGWLTTKQWNLVLLFILVVAAAAAVALALSRAQV